MQSLIRTAIVIAIICCSTSNLVCGQTGLFVTLSFDDTLSEHYDVAQLMELYDMRGTFYVNSVRIGSTKQYMTKQELDEISKKGHEIGGHTISHPRLSQLPFDKAKSEICDDKLSLDNMGFDVTSFAFPFGDVNVEWAQIATSCNYKSCRTSGGIETPFECQGCPKYLSLPINKSVPIRSISYRVENGPSYITNAITNAKNTITSSYGWIIFIFHRVVDDPTDIFSIPRSRLESILEFIQQQQDVAVVTTNQIVSTPVNKLEKLFRAHIPKGTSGINPTFTRTTASVPITTTPYNNTDNVYTNITTSAEPNSNTVLISVTSVVGTVVIIGVLVLVGYVKINRGSTNPTIQDAQNPVGVTVSGNNLDVAVDDIEMQKQFDTNMCTVGDPPNDDDKHNPIIDALDIDEDIRSYYL